MEHLTEATDSPCAAFECRRCGDCCRGSGRVRLLPSDIDALGALLGLTAETFTARYAKLDESRRGLILIDGADGACVFLKKGRFCAVHARKPFQCRQFPSAWRNPDSGRTCPGLKAMDRPDQAD